MFSMIQQNPFGGMQNPFGGMMGAGVGNVLQASDPLAMMGGMSGMGLNMIQSGSIPGMNGMNGIPGMPPVFGADQVAFSPEAMMGAGPSSFMNPMMGMNNFGTPPIGMNGGMGMVPGMNPMMNGGMQGMQDQQMMQMMMMILMMLMMLMQQNGMGQQGMMGGMPGGMPGMQGMPGMMGGMPGMMGGMPGMMGGMPGGFGTPMGMTAPGMPGGGFGAPGVVGAGFGSPLGMAPGMMNGVGGVNPLAAGSYNVSSEFGPRGQIGNIPAGFHGGIDLAAPMGTPIQAAQSGVVSKVGSNDGTGYGNWVEITHANGSSARYAHMSQFGNIAQGQPVQAGQVIGFVGSTGNSTGPHLHFETRDPSGRMVNPRTQRMF